MRLPGNRFRLEIEDKLTLPRSAGGSVDVHGTTQLLNDVVERWVREDPASGCGSTKDGRSAARAESIAGRDSAAKPPE